MNFHTRRRTTTGKPKFLLMHRSCVTDMLRWHGDVKPDNILRVRDKWKLADFGFAEFRRVKDANSQPTADMRGGTETYGMEWNCIGIP
jgi:hypothetical protein